MAGNYRIYYSYRNEEHSIEQWLNTNNPTIGYGEVMEAVMKEAPDSVGVTIIRLVDLEQDGRPTLFDEFRIIDSNGVIYGLIFKKIAHDGWFYLPDYTDFGRRPGKHISNDSFSIAGAAGYTIPNKGDFPALATIDWDRLSVTCNGEEFYLVPWSPSP